MMRHLLNIFIVCMVTASLLQAQDMKHGIRVVAQSYGDSIVLRWAPTTATAWQVANSNGYYVVRYLLMKDSVLQEKTIPQLLTEEALRPWPLNQWVVYQKDQYAAIAAQALYGKKFQLNTGQMGANVSQIYQKAKETELRHSFAMLAADMSHGASVASALRFTDRDIKPGERYVYKVYTRHERIAIDTGFYYIGTNDTSILPKPYDVQASILKGTVAITWNKAYFHDVYTAYIIERSEDNGQTYNAISPLPFINTYRDGQMSDRGLFSDSLKIFNKKLLYRLKGITAFAETGPPSDPVEVVGVESLRATPVISRTDVINNNEVHIRWEFPQGDEKTLRKFLVERAAHTAQGFQVLDSIGTTGRSYTDTMPLQTGYYRVRAIGLDGNERVSLTHMAQRIDSLPPAMPLMLSGVMDTTGVVKLAWKSNRESDLLGYRVFRANFDTDEFFQITSTALKDTIFYDTLNTKVLSDTVYYKIAAVDYNGNRSDFSPINAVTRYDNIPPVAPLFQHYQSSSSAIRLSWIPSTSTDVTRTVLYRRIKGHKYWKTIAVLTPGDTTRHYYDKDVTHGHTYEYRLQAYDGTGLVSPEKILAVQKVDSGLRPPIEHFRAVADRKKRCIKLEWVYQTPAVKFHVYRQATGETTPALYATLDGSTKVFTDNTLMVGTNYTYRIKAVCRDGGESPFSDSASVNY